MMSVELGQGMGRPRAEMWFERVMALDPNNYEACVAMSNYLEPRWYGSDEEALKFARKCVVSKRWGGGFPWFSKRYTTHLPLTTTSGRRTNIGIALTFSPTFKQATRGIFSSTHKI